VRQSLETGVVTRKRITAQSHMARASIPRLAIGLGFAVLAVAVPVVAPVVDPTDGRDLSPIFAELARG
jgi:hypothetical protein